MKLRAAESRAEDTNETFAQIMWSVARRLLTMFLFKEPVMKLKYRRVREHVSKHKKLLRTDTPIRGLTYSLAEFSSDIIIGVQIS